MLICLQSEDISQYEKREVEVCRCNEIVSMLWRYVHHSRSSYDIDLIDNYREI